MGRGVEREGPGHGAPRAPRPLRLPRPRHELGDEAREHAAVLRAPLLPVARGLDAVEQVAVRCPGLASVYTHGLGARSEEDLDDFAIVSEHGGEQGRMPPVCRLIRVCAVLQEIVGGIRSTFLVAASKRSFPSVTTTLARYKKKCGRSIVGLRIHVGARG